MQSTCTAFEDVCNLPFVDLVDRYVHRHKRSRHCNDKHAKKDPDGPLNDHILLDEEVELGRDH